MATLDLTPGGLDLKVYSGDENRMVLQVLAGGVPMDLTGVEIAAQARSDRLPATAVGVDAVVVPVDAAMGLFALTWDGEVLRTLIGSEPSWVGVWDLQLLGLGKVLPESPLGGTFTAMPDVTREAAP
jgi:hypothetical protein